MLVLCIYEKEYYYSVMCFAWNFIHKSLFFLFLELEFNVLRCYTNDHWSLCGSAAEQKVKVPSMHCDGRVKTVSADVMNLPRKQIRTLSPQVIQVTTICVWILRYMLIYYILTFVSCECILILLKKNIERANTSWSVSVRPAYKPQKKQ